MDPDLPARTLLELDLHHPAGPAAVIAAGAVDTPTHLTWQVSGMGIEARTAAWGSAREAAQLARAQQQAGAPRPCVVSWLGHPGPRWWRTLDGGVARRGATRLADHLESWFRHAETAGSGPTVHTAVEAHSYGTLVAAHALVSLARADPARRVDALVLSGAVGLPRALAQELDRQGLHTGRVYEASAPADVLAALGRILAGRVPWRGATALPVTAGDGLAGVRGHDTSRWRPEEGPDAGPRGYRDPGTVTLAAMARATVGPPQASA